MRTINFLLVLFAVLAVSACSENEALAPEASKKQVNLIFSAQPDFVVSAGTRAAATSLIDPAKFSFYAFKKTGDKFSFEQVISDAAATYADGKWNSEKALITVGTYRFLCIYNLGSKQALPAVAELLKLTDMTWADIKNGIVITHQSNTADADEFFSEESIKEVNIAEGNNFIVAFNPLSRVTSRIDVKFVKMATDGQTEVMYSGANTIFGVENNLKSITQTIGGLANKFSLGANAALESIWNQNCVFTFAPVGNLVTIGKKIDGNSTFPMKDESNMDDTAAMAARIVKGGAYFRGAYVLPFMKDTKLTNIAIHSIGGDVAAGTFVERTITTTGLPVKKNFITLVTVKLKSSTDPANPGGGDDNENIFNPKVGWTVTIESKYNGVNNSEVVIE